MSSVFVNTDPCFRKISAVILNEIDNVKGFALITIAIIERDFKSEYLFCTCSVATNLVTSLQFHSDLCNYVVPFLANYGIVPHSLIFTPNSRTATNSATNEYGTVPEWPSRNEEQNSKD